MRKIQLVLVALIVLILSAFKADHVITIYMIGDSTMSNKPLEGNNQERGWRKVWDSQGAGEHLQTKLYDLPHFCSKEIQKAILDFFNKELNVKQK